MLTIPENELTDNIVGCVHWYANLPSIDPRRNIDGAHVVAELCRRNVGYLIEVYAGYLGVPSPPTRC